MRKLALLFALAACATVPGGPGSGSVNTVTIPGASLAEVRDAAAAQLVSKGYTIVSSDEANIMGEKPAAGDLSGYFFDARHYRIGESRSGIVVYGGGQFVDRRPLALRTYDPKVDMMRMSVENAFPADLEALKRQFTH